MISAGPSNWGLWPEIDIIDGVKTPFARMGGSAFFKRNMVLYIAYIAICTRVQTVMLGWRQTA